MKRSSLVNRRVVFKLRGLEPLDATVLRQDDAGYWIQGGTLAGQLDRSNCSVPENDVRYLEFNKIEWLRTARPRVNSLQP
jgi:hypothetical protein